MSNPENIVTEGTAGAAMLSYLVQRLVKDAGYGILGKIENGTPTIKGIVGGLDLGFDYELYFSKDLERIIPYFDFMLMKMDPVDFRTIAIRLVGEGEAGNYPSTRELEKIAKRIRRNTREKNRHDRRQQQPVVIHLLEVYQGTLSKAAITKQTEWRVAKLDKGRGYVIDLWAVDMTTGEVCSNTKWWQNFDLLQQLTHIMETTVVEGTDDA